jgi:hypothetical protein
MRILHKKSFQEFFYAGNYVIQTAWLESDRLFSAESEETLCEVRGFLGGGKHLIYILSEWTVFGYLHFQQASVSYEARENIIEIMSDRACKLTYCLHFLGLKELGLQLFFFSPRVFAL